jgi:hypothetical protein
MQKLYNEYHYDKESVKKKEESVTDKMSDNNSIKQDVFGNSDKTTKFTTINSINKNA